MQHRINPALASLLAALTALAALGSAFALAAQEAPPLEIDARKRLLPGVGAGIRALCLDAKGNLYVLRAPAPSVDVYDPEGKLLREVPAVAPAPAPAPEKSTAHSESSSAGLVFGEGLDVDAEGRIYVADRGANAVRVFGPDGASLVSIPVAEPISVAVLGKDEIAVTSTRSAHLVTVYSLSGALVRAFGDPVEIAERSELNRYLNIGRLARDSAAHLYYCFSFLPEPTVRKFDRLGFASSEITLDSIEVLSRARAARREIAKQEEGGVPRFKTTINAFGVDPESQELWMALGTELFRFDRDGNRRENYRAYTPEGYTIEPNFMLVEPDRLILAADPLGIYEFARPDKVAH